MNVHTLIFGIYFAIVFFIGWYSMKKTVDERDYWIAGGNLGWALGGATLAATHTSAGTFIGSVGAAYVYGWSWSWLLISIPLGYWFMAAVLAPRFTRVSELTLPAFIERRYYSKGARTVAAAIILVAIVIFIQAQIVAGGLVANIVFGLPVTEGMILFTIVLIAYTVVGGMLAVVYTDFAQLAIMVIGTIVALPMALRHVDGLSGVFTFLQAVKPEALQWGALPGTLLFTMAMSFFLGSVATPEKLVRLYAMKDMRHIRRGILLTIIVVTVLNVLVKILALAVIVLFPVLATGDLAMPVIARAVLPSFIGTLMLAAITSAMMSTVDSLLIVAGSALSEDIYQSLFDPHASHRRRLVVARLGILVVGTVPLLLVLSGVARGELVQFIVLMFTSLMASSFFMPVVLGVFWRRTTKEGAIAAMIAGVVFTSLWKLFGVASIDPVLPGFIGSTAILVLVSLATPPPPASALEPYFGQPQRAAGPGVRR